MALTRARNGTPADIQMLAVADRLFHEFDELPIITVIRALGSARAALREMGEPVTPEAVESLARGRLMISHSGQRTRVHAVA